MFENILNQTNQKFIEAKYRIKAIEFLREIYEYYQKYLTEHQMIDYSDMINLSYKYIIKEVKNKYHELNYRYIIVDEYQDITFQRFLFVKKLVEYFNAKLISVGDDWQSIYAFTGSRLELFNRFSEMFLNSKDDMYLSTTYRYGQELVDITSKFILENNEQSKKNIKAIKYLENPIELHEYRPFAEERRLFYVALTRTRNKVYLVVPMRSTSKSEFISEIESLL